MIQLTRGRIGIISVQWTAYEQYNVPAQDNAFLGPDMSGIPYDNGQTTSDGFILMWNPVSALFDDNVFRDRTTPGHPNNTVNVFVYVPEDAASALYIADIVSLYGNTIDFFYDRYTAFFEVTDTVFGPDYPICLPR